MSRFELVALDQVKEKSEKEYDNHELDSLEAWEQEPEVIWDNFRKEVAFCRWNLEPEDATLDRAFEPLINLLNEVAPDYNS